MRAGIVVLIFATAAILWVEVTGRIIGHNWTGYEEILTIAVFWMYMLGCAYSSREDTHIKADIISVMMKDGFVKNLLGVIRWILTTALCLVLFVWSIGLIQWSIEQGNETPVYRLPVAIGQFSMVFGFGLSSVYNIIYLIDSIRKLIGKPREPEFTEEEKEMEALGIDPVSAEKAREVTG